jgi:hypothetical protein
MVSVENFHRSARVLPATRRHAGSIPLIATPQVTASSKDFAVSLGIGRTAKMMGALLMSAAEPVTLLAAS